VDKVPTRFHQIWWLVPDVLTLFLGEGGVPGKKLNSGPVNAAGAGDV